MNFHFSRDEPTDKEHPFKHPFFQISIHISEARLTY